MTVEKIDIISFSFPCSHSSFGMTIIKMICGHQRILRCYPCFLSVGMKVKLQKNGMEKEREGEPLRAKFDCLPSVCSLLVSYCIIPFAPLITLLQILVYVISQGTEENKDEL